MKCVWLLLEHCEELRHKLNTHMIHAHRPFRENVYKKIQSHVFHTLNALNAPSSSNVVFIFVLL